MKKENCCKKARNGGGNQQPKDIQTVTQITLEDVGGGRDHPSRDGLSQEEITEGTVLVNPDPDSMENRG